MKRFAHPFLIPSLAVIFTALTCSADIIYVSEELPPCLNTCGQVVSLNTSGGSPQVVVPGSLTGAPYMAMDSAGNIFSVTSNSRGVLETNTQGVSTVLTSDSGGQILQMAADLQGNVWLTFVKGNAVAKVTPGGVVTYPLSANVLLPGGLTFDDQGTLYLTDYNSSSNSSFPRAIYKFVNGSQTLFATTGTQRPFDLVVDSNHNVYVSYLSGTIEKFSSGGQDLGQFAFVSGARGLALDSSGNLFVAGLGGNVVEFNSSGTQIFSIDLSAGQNPGLPFNIGVAPAASAVPEPRTTMVGPVLLLFVVMFRSRRRRPTAACGAKGEEILKKIQRAKQALECVSTS